MQIARHWLVGCELQRNSTTTRNKLGKKIAFHLGNTIYSRSESRGILRDLWETWNVVVISCESVRSNAPSSLKNKGSFFKCFQSPHALLWIGLKCNRAYTIQDLYNGFPRCLKPYYMIMIASSWFPNTNTIDLVSEQLKQVTTRFHTSPLQLRTSYLKWRQMEVVKEIPFITQGSLKHRKTYVNVK